MNTIRTACGPHNAGVHRAVINIHQAFVFDDVAHIVGELQWGRAAADLDVGLYFLEDTQTYLADHEGAGVRVPHGAEGRVYYPDDVGRITQINEGDVVSVDVAARGDKLQHVGIKGDTELHAGDAHEVGSAQVNTYGFAHFAVHVGKGDADHLCVQTGCEAKEQPTQQQGVEISHLNYQFRD